MAYTYRIRVAAPGAAVQTVPDYARPQRPILRLPAPGARSLNGEPVGAQGYPALVFVWEDHLQVRGLRWWLRWLPPGRSSRRLSYVEAPYWGYDYGLPFASQVRAGKWFSGTLEFPEIADGAWQDILFPDAVETDVIKGRVTVRITNLGRVFG